jgi:excinuclease UvrABC nuclease subunit
MRIKRIAGLNRRKRSSKGPEEERHVADCPVCGEWRTKMVFSVRKGWHCGCKDRVSDRLVREEARSEDARVPSVVSGRPEEWEDTEL